VNDRLNILIADDHALVREGLKLTLGELPAVQTVIEAADADEVRTALAEQPDIDLVILDLHMPGSSELELLGSVCNSHPEIPVIVLSASESPRVMQRAIDRGAAGFIPKSAANNVLISALQLVLSGGVYIPAEMIGAPQGRNSTQPDQTATACDTPRRSTSVRPALTGRQIDVLELLSEGASNKAIAQKLGLSEHTVKIHLTTIFKALGVNNRTEAALAFRELGPSSLK
jgi:DNA-binding NarL/FixJ family response regulator